MLKPYFYILFIEYSSFTPNEKILLTLMVFGAICISGLTIARILDSNNSKPQKLTPGIYIYSGKNKKGDLLLSKHCNGKFIKGLYKNQKNVKWLDDEKDGNTYALKKQNDTYYFLLHEEEIIHA